MKSPNDTVTLSEDNLDSYKAKSYSGIYSLHKYWSKKPYNIIKEFIEEYTQPTEIVLDPFCGSGVAITESIFANRRAIGIDLNPSAIFITQQVISKISTQKLSEEFTYLERQCKDTINSYYLVKRDEEILIASHYIWNKGTLEEVWYNKSKENIQGKNQRIRDIPQTSDIVLTQSFSYTAIPYFYPKQNFFHNSRINASKNLKVYELFTPRNLLALSFLYNKIEQISDQNIKNFFKFCFTSSIGQTSKMVFVIKRRGKLSNSTDTSTKKEVGSWVIGYWVPQEHFEINVWNCFETRFRKMFKVKQEQENEPYSINKAKDFSEFLSLNSNLLLFNDSSLNVLKTFPSDSIDYIITDPPHGNRIPYLEQSLLWNSWLKHDVNYEEEIIISDAKERKKDKENYFTLLFQVLEQIARILKPHRYFSLMFNSLDDDTWIRLMTYLNNLNFSLHKVETLGYSATSVVQDSRNSGLKTDFIITFKKTQKEHKKPIILCTLEKDFHDLKSKIDGYFANSEKPLEVYDVLNYLFVELLQENKIVRVSEVVNYLSKNSLGKRKLSDTLDKYLP